MLSAVVNEGNTDCASRKGAMGSEPKKISYSTNTTYHGFLWKDMSVASLIAMFGMGMRK
jgi:hypothetical protein